MPIIYLKQIGHLQSPTCTGGKSCGPTTVRPTVVKHICMLIYRETWPTCAGVPCVVRLPVVRLLLLLKVCFCLLKYNLL